MESYSRATIAKLEQKMHMKIGKKHRSDSELMSLFKEERTLALNEVCNEFSV